MKNQILKTIQYYEKETKNLIKSYNNADMSIFQQFINDNVTLTGKIIDIGCGSGRDLEYFLSKGFNIYGVDANKYFIKEVKNRFPKFKNNFVTSSLPKLDIPFNNFNVAILVAVWMHIPKEEQEKSIKSIVSIMKEQSQIVFSYSIEDRDKSEERFFEKLNENDLVHLFSKYGYSLKNSVVIKDGLNGRDIQWVTQIFERKA